MTMIVMVVIIIIIDNDDDDREDNIMLKFCKDPVNTVSFPQQCVNNNYNNHSFFAITVVIVGFANVY